MARHTRSKKRKNHAKEFIVQTREKSKEIINHTKEHTKRLVSETKERSRILFDRTKDIILSRKIFQVELYLADAFSFMNLFCGLISIYFSISRQFLAAVLFIFIAVAFDFFDGRISRYFERESLLGLQLDSLADLVSFSVSVSVLMLVYYGFSIPLLIASFALVGAGAYRLARFNVLKVLDPGNKTYLGTPITWNGIVFPGLFFLELPSLVIAILFLTFSFLMVSRIRIRKVI